jgi:hypothetical protein
MTFRNTLDGKASSQPIGRSAGSLGSRRQPNGIKLTTEKEADSGGRQGSAELEAP